MGIQYLITGYALYCSIFVCCFFGFIPLRVVASWDMFLFHVVLI